MGNFGSKLLNFLKQGASKIANIIPPVNAYNSVKQITSPGYGQQLLKASIPIRNFGTKVGEYGSNLTQPNVKDNFISSMVKTQVGRPIQLAGYTVAGAGRLGELASEPKKTFETFKKAPTFTLKSMGDYENPSKASLVSDVLAPSADITDIAKFGGIAAAGTVLSKGNKAKQLAKIKPLSTAIFDLQSRIKDFKSLRPAAQIDTITKAEKVGVEVVPEVMKTKEMKQLAKTDVEKWLFEVDKFVTDKVLALRGNDYDFGLSVKPIKREAHEPLLVNPKGSLKTQPVADLQIGKQELGLPLKNEISTPTRVNEAVSLPPNIDKGKLNINRLNVKGAGKKALEQIEETVQPTVIGNKEVIDTARTAKGTSTMSDEQMKKLMAQQLKNRQVVVDITGKYNEAKKGGASEVELGKIMLELADQSRTARQGGTFAGRLLQAQNIVADESASPMQKILALLDNAGVSEEKYLKDAVKVNWDNPAEVVSFYRKYVPAKFGEVVDEIRYSNMLSSPLTHIVNVTSNAVQTGLVAPIEKTITGTLDFGKSLLTGSERQYYARSGIDYAGGYVKALPQAFKKAWNVLSGKEMLIKPDYERIPTGTKGVLKAYTAPLRALEGMDQFFKTLVEGGVTAELKHGPQKLSNIKISGMATKEANYRLFRQAFDPSGELGQGAVLKMFDKWNSAIANIRRLPGGKWVLPFMQTPTNILKQGLEYSPLGITTAIGAKNPTEQISKALIGTGVFMGAYQLAKNGLTSWEAPTSETERDLYYSAGMQPYSVKIGDKWVSFSKLGPLSYPMAMAAALANAEKNYPDKSKVENIGKSISGMLGFFGDQSYVRSIGDLVDAIQGGVNIGPNALSAEGANLAGQLVPYKSFLTWLGRMIDPTYRKAKTFGERMTKDLPIVGSKLEPYTDLNGQPSVRDFPVLNAVSPYKVTQEKMPASELLKKYQTKKIEKGVEKRADEELLAGDKTNQTTGNIYRYVDDNGAVKKIDLSFPLPTYNPTGDSTLDKELLSDYNGALTTLKNQIMKAWEVGAINQDEAKKQLERVASTKKTTTTTKKSTSKKKVNPYGSLKTSKKYTFKMPTYKSRILKTTGPKALTFNGKTLKLKVDQYKNV